MFSKIDWWVFSFFLFIYISLDQSQTLGTVIGPIWSQWHLLEPQCGNSDVFLTPPMWSQWHFWETDSTSSSASEADLKLKNSSNEFLATSFMFRDARPSMWEEIFFGDWVPLSYLTVFSSTIFSSLQLHVKTYFKVPHFKTVSLSSFSSPNYSKYCSLISHKAFLHLWKIPAEYGAPVELNLSQLNHSQLRVY